MTEGDRFADWGKVPARLLLAALLALLVASALVQIGIGAKTIATPGFGTAAPEKTRDNDLAVYDRAVERIRGGENYYDFIVAEHRRADFPVRPGLAVRLPTLAYLNAALGDTGQAVAAIALMLAVLVAWWRRLGAEPGGRAVRPLAMALLFVGCSLGANRYFFQLHEMWSGMLLALAFGLHRPGKWAAALVVSALALAIREQALPFVLLMAAMAAWRRDWREAAAWQALALVFALGLAWHLSVIAQQTVPSDGVSSSWLALRGLTGWLSNVVLSSNLRFLPHWLAGPLVVLMTFGWAGWRSDAGLTGTLLYTGYAAAFLLAGRNDNYYWGAMIAPALFIGLAFAPLALRSLCKAAIR